MNPDIAYWIEQQKEEFRAALVKYTDVNWDDKEEIEAFIHDLVVKGYRVLGALSERERE